jgi:hypothetical protein
VDVPIERDGDDYVIQMNLDALLQLHEQAGPGEDLSGVIVRRIEEASSQAHMREGENLADALERIAAEQARWP